MARIIDELLDTYTRDLENKFDQHPGELATARHIWLLMTECLKKVSSQKRWSIEEIRERLEAIECFLDNLVIAFDGTWYDWLSDDMGNHERILTDPEIPHLMWQPLTSGALDTILQHGMSNIRHNAINREHLKEALLIVKNHSWMDDPEVLQMLIRASIQAECLAFGETCKQYRFGFPIHALAKGHLELCKALLGTQHYLYRARNMGVFTCLFAGTTCIGQVFYTASSTTLLSMLLSPYVFWSLAALTGILNVNFLAGFVRHQRRVIKLCQNLSRRVIGPIEIWRLKQHENATTQLLRDHFISGSEDLPLVENMHRAFCIARHPQLNRDKLLQAVSYSRGEGTIWDEGLEDLICRLPLSKSRNTEKTNLGELVI